MIEPISQGDLDTVNPITDVDDFFVLSRYKGTKIDLNKWILSLGGLVQKPMKMSYEELTESYPKVSEVATMECVINKVGGNLVGTAIWSGVALIDILREVEVEDGVKYILFESEDSKNRGFPLERFQNPSTLLAYEMNDQTLPVDHGFPLRLVVPGFYGFVWRRWIKGVVLTNEKYKDPQWLNFMKRVKSEKVVLSTKILKPQKDEIINRSPYSIIGVSWGGEKKIDRVEVSLDDGLTWNPTDIIWRHKNPYVWVVWRYVWTPSRNGHYELTARAIDEEGHVQIDGEDDYPSGLGSWHSVKTKVQIKNS